MSDRELFERTVSRFLDWLAASGTAGYDPYDLWSTAYGVKARRLFYRFGALAAPAVAPIVIADKLFAKAARPSIERKRYATAHGHLILGSLELAKAGIRENKAVAQAVKLGDELDELKITGFSGDCFGYPFDWENRRGLWPKHTPLITVTPYAFEADLALYDATGEARFFERARSIADFALLDLKNTERPDGSVASSYSTRDESLVINASAYRAFVLMTAAERFEMTAAGELGRRLVRFVMNSQRDDGAWVYALGEDGDDFIDHFHTCFVMKNLAKIHHLNGDPEILAALERGYAYYENALFYDTGEPRPFAEGGTRSLKLNLYDHAEATGLGVELRDVIPRALERSIDVARVVAREHQLADGHFATSVDRFGIVQTTPFIRWPQAQLFHSIASLINVI